MKPGAFKRKIYDIFLFHKEFDMLEMRLIELEYVVDWFVIIEPPHTITGTHKPLYFKVNSSTRFTRFMKKIIKFTSEDEKPYPDAWAKKLLYRNMGLTAWKDVDPDTVIIFPDVDEIVL